MLAEIIAIGSELTSGAKLDTNSQWLSIQLSSVGVPVHFHSTVADSVENLISLLKTAANRSDIVIITGGLGPTLDDLTREAMAGVTGVELVLNQTSLNHLKEMFANRDREMPARNQIQAMFPAGSTVIENHRGTAPGIRMEVAREGRSPSILAAFPGVPSEMKPMFIDSILSQLSGSGKVIRRARINCFGAGESRIEEMLGELTARGKNPEVGITASDATITLRIEAAEGSVDECESKIQAVRRQIYETLGELVFGEEDTTLEHIVVGQLAQQGQTLSIVEDATAGLLTGWIAAVDGSDKVLTGGLVGSPLHSTFPLKDAGETPHQLAKAARQKFQSDYAIAIGPVEPNQAGIDSIEFAIIGRSVSFEKNVPMTGNPAIMKALTAKAAINQLRLFLDKTSN